MDHDFLMDWLESWNNETKEAKLRDPQSKPLLLALWPLLSDIPSWLAQDAIDGVTLVDCVSKSSRFANVYRGFYDDKIVCIKIGDPAKCQLQKLQRAFHNEAEILKYLNANGEGPELLDHGKLPSDGKSVPYILMEYCFGLTPVSKYAFERVEEAESFLLDLTDRLAKIHQLGIIHCDLPGNIFVCEKAKGAGVKPIILDFNVARFADSPEQFREFGPQISFSINEQYFLSRKLTSAFDVACCSLVIDKKLRPFYQEESPQRLEALATLIRDCRQYAPELRPQEGLELKRQLVLAIEGSCHPYSPPLSRQLRLFASSNPIAVLTATTISLLMFALLIMLLMISWFQQRQNEIVQRQNQVVQKQNRLVQDQNQKLTDKVVELRRANEVSLDTMGKLLEVALFDDQLSGRAKKQGVRVELGDSLIEHVLDSSEDPMVRVPSLKFGRNLAMAHVDVDGFRPAHDFVKKCVPAAKEMLSENDELPDLIRLELQLLTVQLLSIQAFSGYELSKSDTDVAVARKLTTEACELYTSIDPAGIQPSLRLEFLRAGYLLGHWAFYAQHREGWNQEEEGRIGRAIFEHALVIDEYRSDEERFIAAHLNATYGRLLYKGGIKAERKANRFNDIERHYSEAIGLASACSQADPNNQSVLAYVKNLNGQFRKAQRQYSLALEESRFAFELSKELVAKYPGSKNFRRELVTNGWNYADVYRARRHFYPNPPDLEHGMLRENEIRAEVVDTALYVFKNEIGNHSREGLTVNLQRIVQTHLLLGNKDEAIHYATQHSETVGLYEPGAKHGFGFAYLAVLLMVREVEEAEEIEQRIDEQINYMCDRFERLRSSERSAARKRTLNYLKRQNALLFASPLLQTANVEAIKQRLHSKLSSLQ